MRSLQPFTLSPTLVHSRYSHLLYALVDYFPLSSTLARLYQILCTLANPHMLSFKFVCAFLSLTSRLSLQVVIISHASTNAQSIVCPLFNRSMSSSTLVPLTNPRALSSIDMHSLRALTCALVDTLRNSYVLLQLRMPTSALDGFVSLRTIHQ